MFTPFNSRAMDDDHHRLQNPNPSLLNQSIDLFPEFELSDYLMFEDGSDEGDLSSQNMASSDNVTAGSIDSPAATSSSSNRNIKNKNGVKRNLPDQAGVKVAFRTKSDLEVMDDGFKWRKYGKKMVKNSPNPRNYYKCSSGGCNVKKRVERDREDPSYVITTYEGIHNHESPSAFYYNSSPHPHLLLQPPSSNSQSSPP